MKWKSILFELENNQMSMRTLISSSHSITFQSEKLNKDKNEKLTTTYKHIAN